MSSTVTAADEVALPGDDGGPELFVYVPAALYAALRQQALREGRTVADLLRAGASGYLALAAMAQQDVR